MEKSFKLDRYAPSAYDQHLCLKPPLLLLIAFAFLSRAITLPVIVHISSLAGGTSDTTHLVQGLFSVSTMVSSCIAALVLYAWSRRSPSGPRSARWIWTRGRTLLAFSAALDALLSVADALVWHPISTDQVATTLLAVSADVYFLTYILASRRVRDTFSDFPPAASL